MLQRYREILALALVTLLPLHAFAVTVLTRAIAGPGHAPLGVLALWKEGVLALILVIALIELARNWRTKITFDALDILVLLLAGIAIAMLPMSRTSPVAQMLGVKYDFLPLLLFVVLRRVRWSEAFVRRMTFAVCIVGAVIAAYGAATLILPMSFFTALGYSDLHSLYVPDAALAPFQNIGGSGLRRVQSVMSGPNQFGLWMLLPWALLWSKLTESCSLQKRDCQWRFVAGVIVAIGIGLSFSRAAWIGAAVIAVAAMYRQLPRKAFLNMTGMCGGALVLIVVAVALAHPSALLRIASSRDHLLRPMEAVQTIIADPLGRGLGSAGPATNRVSDACVFLEEGADASWAADRPDLCVFVASKQVQPVDRGCRCPMLTENWYLQIGVELGVAGMAVFLLLVFAALRALAASAHGRAAFLALLGLSVAALFLHAFEDAAAAWTVWLLAATALAKT